MTTGYVIKRVGYAWFLEGLDNRWGSWFLEGLDNRWGSQVEAAYVFETKALAIEIIEAYQFSHCVIVAVRCPDPTIGRPRYCIARRADGWLWLGEDQWIDTFVPSRPPRVFDYSHDAEQAGLADCPIPSADWEVIPIEDPGRT